MARLSSGRWNFWLTQDDHLRGVTSRRPLSRLLVVAALALGAVLLAAAPASAHAQLTSTEPVGGSAKGGADDAALVEKLLTSGGGSTTVGAIYAVIRFAAFSALVLLVGGFAFLGLVWPAGAGLARARKLLWTAWGAAVATTVIG